MNRKRIGIGKRFTVGLVTLAVCALTGELVLRLWAPFPDYSHNIIHSFPDRYDPHLGYAGIPHLDQRFILPDFNVLIRNNSKGFRDSERRYGKGKGRRILVLGDSHGWGWGVENDRIFSAIMERRLKGWEVINLSQAGYSTDQELIILEMEGLKYKPAIVLLLFCGNDVKDAHSDRIDGIQPKPYYVEEGGDLVLKNVPVPRDRNYWRKKRELSQTFSPERGAGGTFQRLVRKSHFLNWIRFRLAQLYRPDVERGPAVAQEKMRGDLALNLNLIRRMNDLCREKGATLIVVDIPSEYSPLLQEFCGEQAIPYLNLRDALKSRFRPTIFRRVGHWTPYGQMRVAEEVLAFLNRKQLVE